MKDAVEMAVLSSVQHPNIVSVYSCLTDMVEIGGGARDPQGSRVESSAAFVQLLDRGRRVGAQDRTPWLLPLPVRFPLTSRNVPPLCRL